MDDKSDTTQEIPKNRNMLAVFRREFLCGQTPESAKAKWGEAFDDKAWDCVEKIGRANPEEESARPHLRDILKWEHDHPRPRNEALEKWGPSIEAMVERDLAQTEVQRERGDTFRRVSLSPSLPQIEGPDLDRE